MEVLEESNKKNYCAELTNQQNQWGKLECKKTYVQPPRAKPFAPPLVYCPPKYPVDSKTTYHSSYYKENETGEVRPQPYRPTPCISLSADKFVEDTTSKMSFQPVGTIDRTKPIFPHQRLNLYDGRMDDMTTIRQDYSPKFATKPHLIIPCGHIRSNKASLETKTTSLLSYMNPGLIQPVASYKPNLKYCRPSEPTANETTQKLSYLPYEIGKKENHPWSRKAVYRPPEAPMPDETTYTKSYLETKVKKELPILPRDSNVFKSGDDEFLEKTVYRDSFLPRERDAVAPIKPCPNISLSTQKMASDTTNKMSFQPIKGEKRAPILPRQRHILGDVRPIQNLTTSQLEFTMKLGKRPQVIVPTGHIHRADQPLDGTTTTALSYVNPGPVIQLPNYKPDLKYCKPEKKIDGETVNKMSYREWSIGPKEQFPWAQKGQYQQPKNKINGDTVYHMSFSPPGYFIEECNDKEHLSFSNK